MYYSGVGMLPAPRRKGEFPRAVNVLVTGGAGYLGSHTAKALARAGHLPVTYDNLSQGHEWAVAWGPFVRGDLADAELLTRTLSKHHIDAVMHFAAFASVGESMSKPGAYFENNCVNSLRLLEAIYLSGVRKLVFSSSCATYGNPIYTPIDELHPQVPINPYGESKLFTERLMRWYGEIHGLEWVALRYFNAAGADPEGEIGEMHSPETHLIPLLLRAATDASKPFFVFGADYPTPDGTAIRDYVHATDIAEAHLRALDYLVRGGSSIAINLGSGRGYSVLEVVNAVREVVGRSTIIEELGRRPGDPPALIADASRATALLKWAPKLVGLHEIVQTAWAWECKFFKQLPS